MGEHQACRPGAYNSDLYALYRRHETGTFRNRAERSRPAFETATSLPRKSFSGFLPVTSPARTLYSGSNWRSVDETLLRVPGSCATEPDPTLAYRGCRAQSQLPAHAKCSS